MESFTWKSHPAKERPVASVVVFILCLLIFYLVYNFTKSPIMVFTAIVILFISLATFFLPTTYTITKGKVKIKYLFTNKDRNMTAFRAVYPGQKGVLLSPYLSPTRLENFRGFYLRYGKDNKQDIDKFLTDYIEWLNNMKSEQSSEDKNNAE